MKVRRVDFYPDDFLVGVRDLSPLQTGIYWIACSLMYSRGGGIDLDDLRRWVRQDGRHFKAAFDALVAAGKLSIEGATVTQRRVNEELTRAQRRLNGAVTNGQRGGRPRKKDNDLPKATGSPPRDQSSANNNKSNDLFESVKNNALLFDEAYSLYPRHDSRAEALKAWPKALKLIDPVTLRQRIERYAALHGSDDKKFIPLFSSWLNRQRWDDEDLAGGVNGRHDPTDEAAREAARLEARRLLGIDDGP